MISRKFAAFLKRDILENLTFKTQFFMDAASVLAQALIFFYIAKLLNQGDVPALQAYEGGFFSFVLIGIILAGCHSAALESFAKAIYREQGAGTLETILISPTSLHSVVLYSLLWTSIFIALRLIVFLAAGYLFFGAEFEQVNFISAAVTLVLTLSSLSGFGLISAGLVLLLKRADPLAFTLTGISRLISGVYFPLALLPGWAQAFSSVLPLTYSLQAMRKAVLEGASVGEIAPELGALCIFTALLIPAGWFFFGGSVEKSKKDGTLTFV